MAMRTMSTMSTMRLVEIYGCEAVLVDAPYLRVDAWMVWLHGCWGMDVVHSIFNECHNDCSATHEIFIDAPVHPYPLHPGITTSSHPSTRGFKCLLELALSSLANSWRESGIYIIPQPFSIL